MSKSRSITLSQNKNYDITCKKNLSDLFTIIDSIKELVRLKANLEKGCFSSSITNFRNLGLLFNSIEWYEASKNVIRNKYGYLKRAKGDGESELRGVGIRPDGVKFENISFLKKLEESEFTSDYILGKKDIIIEEIEILRAKLIEIFDKEFLILRTEKSEEYSEQLRELTMLRAHLESPSSDSSQASGADDIISFIPELATQIIMKSSIESVISGLTALEKISVDSLDELKYRYIVAYHLMSFGEKAKAIKQCASDKKANFKLSIEVQKDGEIKYEEPSFFDIFGKLGEFRNKVKEPDVFKNSPKKLKKIFAELKKLTVNLKDILEAIFPHIDEMLSKHLILSEFVTNDQKIKLAEIYVSLKKVLKLFKSKHESSADSSEFAGAEEGKGGEEKKESEIEVKSADEKSKIIDENTLIKQLFSLYDQYKYISLSKKRIKQELKTQVTKISKSFNSNIEKIPGASDKFSKLPENFEEIYEYASSEEFESKVTELGYFKFKLSEKYSRLLELLSKFTPEEELNPKLISILTEYKKYLSLVKEEDKIGFPDPIGDDKEALIMIKKHANKKLEKIEYPINAKDYEKIKEEEKKELIKLLDFIIDEANMQKEIRKKIDLSDDEIKALAAKNKFFFLDLLDEEDKKYLTVSQAFMGCALTDLRDKSKFKIFHGKIIKYIHPELNLSFLNMGFLRSKKILHGEVEKLSTDELVYSSEEYINSNLNDIKALRSVFISEDKNYMDIFKSCKKIPSILLEEFADYILSSIRLRITLKTSTLDEASLIYEKIGILSDAQKEDKEYLRSYINFKNAFSLLLFRLEKTYGRYDGYVLLEEVLELKKKYFPDEKEYINVTEMNVTIMMQKYASEEFKEKMKRIDDQSLSSYIFAIAKAFDISKENTPEAIKFLSGFLESWEYKDSRYSIYVHDILGRLYRNIEDYDNFKIHLKITIDLFIKFGNEYRLVMGRGEYLKLFYDTIQNSFRYLIFKRLFSEAKKYLDIGIVKLSYNKDLDVQVNLLKLHLSLLKLYVYKTESLKAEKILNIIEKNFLIQFVYLDHNEELSFFCNKLYIYSSLNRIDKLISSINFLDDENLEKYKIELLLEFYELKKTIAIKLKMEDKITKYSEILLGLANKLPSEKSMAKFVCIIDKIKQDFSKEVKLGKIKNYTDVKFYLDKLIQIEKYFLDLPIIFVDSILYRVCVTLLKIHIETVQSGKLSKKDLSLFNKKLKDKVEEIKSALILRSEESFSEVKFGCLLLLGYLSIKNYSFLEATIYYEELTFGDYDNKNIIIEDYINSLYFFSKALVRNDLLTFSIKYFKKTLETIIKYENMPDLSSDVKERFEQYKDDSLKNIQKIESSDVQFFIIEKIPYIIKQKIGISIAKLNLKFLIKKEKDHADMLKISIDIPQNIFEIDKLDLKKAIDSTLLLDLLLRTNEFKSEIKDGKYSIIAKKEILYKIFFAAVYQEDYTPKFPESVKDDSSHKQYFGQSFKYFSGTYESTEEDESDELHPVNQSLSMLDNSLQMPPLDPTYAADESQSAAVGIAGAGAGSGSSE